MIGNRSKKLFLSTMIAAALTLGLTASSFAQGVLQATADLTGDGVPERVYNMLNGVMRVVNPDGSQHSYFLTSNPGGWAILGGQAGIKDLDGIAGGEMAVNVGSVVIVVTHRTNSIQAYSLPGTGWSLLGGAAGISDFDGVAGAEVPINMGPSIIFITHRTGTLQSMATSSGTWFILPGPGGINDFDGLPGNEVAITASGGTVRILHPANGVTRNYFVTSGAYSLLAVGDLDGQPGQEITLRLGTTNNTRVINDRLGTIQ